MKWQELQAAIMMDKLSGAVDVARAVANMLLVFAEEESVNSPEEIINQLQHTGGEILTAQSGMASLVTLLNRIFFAVSGEADIDAMTLVLQEVTQTFIAEQNACRDQVSKKATALIPAETTILTHSASSTVFKTIVNAHKSGRNPVVICPEARPFYEGRTLAANLAEAGIRTTLIVDSGMYANLPQTELILVGADSLSEKGIVSKIGTASLAVCGQSLGIPCYFLADTSKIWPAELGEQPIHERSAADVWPDAPQNVTVQNHFYDTTPWTAVAGVITEQGLLTMDEVRARSRSKPIHPLMHRVIADVRSTI